MLTLDPETAYRSVRITSPMVAQWQHSGGTTPTYDAADAVFSELSISSDHRFFPRCGSEPMKRSVVCHIFIARMCPGLRRRGAAEF